MRVQELDSNSNLDLFFELESKVYQGNPNYRGGNKDLFIELIRGSVAFSRRCCVRAYLVWENESVIGRFILAVDLYAKDKCLVFGFEALNGNWDMANLIIQVAKQAFPDCDELVVGINAHLNYGAGILDNLFEEVPLYDTNYNPRYYSGYFSTWEINWINTFLVSVSSLAKLYGFCQNLPLAKSVYIRASQKSTEKEDIALYTELNNRCFQRHPFWTERTFEEDLEMFSATGHGLGSFLLFAEECGKAIGFLLWYPDYNQPERRRCRLYEVAVLPQYRRSFALPALLAAFYEKAKEGHYIDCEGGFILSQNQESMAMAARLIQRASGKKPEPYRRLAIYRHNLGAGLC